jgi:hypothetical protein
MPRALGALQHSHATVYGALLSLFGSLLGFVIAAIAIALPFASDKRLVIIRESAQNITLWKLFFSGTRALAFATLVALIALIFDRDEKPRPFLIPIVFYAVALASVRLFRVVWALEWIVEILVKPHMDKAQAPALAPTIAPNAEVEGANGP